MYRAWLPASIKTEDVENIQSDPSLDFKVKAIHTIVSSLALLTHLLFLVRNRSDYEPGCKMIAAGRDTLRKQYDVIRLMILLDIKIP